MCGRFSLGIPYAEIQQLHGYNVEIGEWVDQDQFIPRHNVAPRSQAPVLRRREDWEDRASGSGPSDTMILQTMKWGLVPHWSKHEDTTMSTINARCEKLIDGGGMWASIKGRRRCAVICEGYYEWLKKGKERLPYFTKHQNGNLMLLAGLYDRVVLEGSTEPLWTFTVVTTAACKELSWLHDRQPVILPTVDALATWLDTSSGKWSPELTKLVEPHHDSTSPLVCYQVPKEVGKIGTESPSFIEPIAERKDGIQAMFTQQHGTKTSQSPPKAKRKRSPSPRISSPVEDNKKPKIEKANACENDSYIECIDDPSAAGSSNTQLLSNRAASSSAYPSTEESPGKSRSTAKRVKSPSSPKKAKMPVKKFSASSKITSFFGKT